MRAGLLVARFDLPVTCEVVAMRTDAFAEALSRLSPSRTVPTLRLDDGTVVCESLAIAEELATRFPDAGLWPDEPAARATARALAAEMHAGFAALRGACPMNLRRAHRDVPVGADVAADLARLERIWSAARERFGGGEPWLCGRYSVADAFFAPVAARIAGYGLPVGKVAAAYVSAHLADAAFRDWRAAALAEGPDQPVYDRPWPATAWPDRVNPAETATSQG